MSRYLIRSLSYAVVLLCAAQQLLAQSAGDQHQFTVADSIGMTTFSDPYTRNPSATAKEAADHSGFIVVTTKGLLSTDELESCLWYYSSRSVRQYLHSAQEIPTPNRQIFCKRGRLVSNQTNSYGSLISDVQWASDSHSVLASVEEKNAVKHLYRIQIGEHSVLDLTPTAKSEIKAASASGSTSIYLLKAATPKNVRDRTQAAEIVRTGQSLPHILYPDLVPDAGSSGQSWELEVTSRGHHYALPGYPAAAALNFPPVLSPDGNTILSAMPVSEVPADWADYRSALSAFAFYPTDPTVDRHGRSFQWPWQYAIVNVKTKAITPLWNAPVAWLSGYGNVQRASWSPSGHSVLVTNTYMPIRLGTSSKNSIKPCAIAVYHVVDGNFACIVESKYPDTPSYLVDAHFDGSDERIAAQWLRAGSRDTMTYEYTNKMWHETTESKSLTLDQKPALRLALRQDLTAPPVLWAYEGNEAKLLWNPNPQLTGKRLATGSIINWKDGSGYVWRGALLLPTTPRPPSGYPLVIQTHGLTNDHEFMPDGAFTTSFAAQPLANAGMAVLQVEDRSDRHQLAADQEAEAHVMGYISAIDYLHQRDVVDVSSVGIIGFSRTHWYVERALEEYPSAFKAAILIDGVTQSYMTDMIFAPESISSKHEHEAANDGTPYGNTLTNWIKNAVGFNVDRISAAVRLEAITSPSILGEWETYSILRQQGKPVDLVEIPHAQHILQNPRNRFASQQGDVDWFRFWLQGYERPDAEDDDQYIRWRRMREQQNAFRRATADVK